METKKPVLQHLLKYGGLTLAVVLIGIFLFQDPLSAQQVAAQSSTGSGTGLLIARIFQVILGIALVVSLGFLVYGAFLVSSAEGDEIQEARGKRILKISGVVFGTVAILFLLLTFFISRLRRTAAPTQQLPAEQVSRGLGGFPSSLLEAHYPENGQRNLSRNTSIMITFTEAMDISTLINDGGTPDDPSDDLVNTTGIKIFNSNDDPVAGPFVVAKAQVTEDGRTFLFTPTEYLGSPSQNTLYSVVIDEGVTSENGLSSFAELGVYTWEFEVSTTVDLDPPHIVSIFPGDGSTHPRNAVVQVTFNEAMNPLTVSGSISRGFDNIALRDESGELIEGRFLISNQYRTVEFITNDYCGTNSCNEDIYCLPGGQEISLQLRAASVSAQPPAALFPFDGITDAASNSFDGNLDGSGTGSPEDDLALSFSITNEIDKTPPVISTVTPGPFATNVSLADPFVVSFDKPIQFSTINRQSVKLPNVPDYQILASTENGASKLTISHSGLQQDVTYSPGITSDIRDLYQNCYRPCVGP